MKSKKEMPSPEPLDQSLQEFDIPEDVQQCWYQVARRAQAACSGNKGYGLLTLTVVVNRNKAVMWLPPGMEKIEPARISEDVEMSAETMVSLAILASNNGSGS